VPCLRFRIEERRHQIKIREEGNKIKYKININQIEDSEEEEEEKNTHTLNSTITPQGRRPRYMNIYYILETIKNKSFILYSSYIYILQNE
jgi:hypothetical protein